MRRLKAAFLLSQTAALMPISAAADDDNRKAERPMPPFISPAGKPYRSAVGEPFAKASWFSAVDVNADGSLTVDELVAEAEAFFEELDTDRDGRIGPDEIVHYEQVVAPEVQAGFMPSGASGMRPPPGMPIPSGRGGGPPGGGSPPGMKAPSQAMMKKLANMPQGAARFAILGMPQPIISADRNMNGSVTPDEMQDAAAQRFGWLNNMGNGDGRVGWDELPQAPIEDMMKLPTKNGKKKKQDEDQEIPGQRRPIP